MNLLTAVFGAALVSGVEISPGAADATARIQAGIDAAFRAGGGRVTLAAGTYDVTSVRLRSGVGLYLKSGAHLRGSRNPLDYDGKITADAVEPFDGARCATPDALAVSSTNHWNNAIIRIYGAHDVSIVGEPGSVIDGRNCYDAKGEEQFRGPHGIAVHFSTNVVFRGYELRDAGNWSHRICLSADVTVQDVRIRGGHDGLDFHACDRVTVSDCDLQTGDDCIAGYDIRNLTVRRCRLNTACSVFRIGGRDILVEDVTATAPAAYCHRRTLPEEDKVAGTNSPDRGRRTTLSFFTYYGTPRARGRSANIVFRRCRISGVERFFHYNFSGSEWWQSGWPLEDVTFEHVIAEAVKLPLCAYAPDDCPLVLSFKDSCIAFAETVAEFAKGANIGSVIADGLTVEGVKGPFVRTWKGEPTYETKRMKGIGRNTEKAVDEFSVDPV